MRTWILILLWA